jgi:hypothetical protein
VAIRRSRHAQQAGWLQAHVLDSIGRIELVFMMDLSGWPPEYQPLELGLLGVEQPFLLGLQCEVGAFITGKQCCEHEGLNVG